MVVLDRTQLLKEVGFVKNKGEPNEKVEEEVTEILKGVWDKTGFPKPLKRYHLSFEVYDLSLEEPYYWVLDTIKDSYPQVIKLEDSFAAAENSAFFGVTQQRLGIQQDKVSQFLATTGKMIKELFQMVRELRIIDERMGYYEEVAAELEKEIGKRIRSAEITLKGFFVDLVQGGGKSAASVYGMAQNLEFITLPDLFFDAPPFKDVNELHNHVKNLEKDFNNNVLRVLERHLRQYMEWRKRTHSEHKSRKHFMLTYLEQHYQIINMYINWVKPYLRNVNKLSLKEKNMASAELVSAFEGSMLDVEILGRKKIGGANSCILATFQYRTRAEMKVNNEYQRGPVHIGKMDLELRAYVWTDKQIENYQKLKERENLMLFGEISASVGNAMEALGDVLLKYLDEARGLREDKKKQEEKKDDGAPKSIWSGLSGIFSNPRKQKELSDKEKAKEAKAKAKKAAEAFEKNKGAATGHTYFMTWLTYKNFKKAHRMIQW